MATPPHEPRTYEPRNSGLASGLTFAVVVVLFTLFGRWLDTKLDTTPWLMVLGAMLGLLGGTIHLLAALAPGTLPFGPKHRTPSGRAGTPANADSKPRADSRPTPRPDPQDEPRPPPDDGQPR